MIYGKNKVRNMVRSLLPSTARVRARTEKRLVKKAVKSKNRALLKHAVDDEGYWYTPLFDSDTRKVRSIVYERRGGDKVGPFISWAEAITKDLRPLDKASFIRSLVPKNTIGSHALTHLPREITTHPNTLYVQSLPKYPRPYVSRYRTTNPYVPLLSTDSYEDLVRLAWCSGYHEELNRHIIHYTTRAIVSYEVYKGVDGTYINAPIYARVGPEHARKLLGLHDVTAFVNDLKRAKRAPRYHLVRPPGGNAYSERAETGERHPEWLNSLDDWLRRQFPAEYRVAEKRDNAARYRNHPRFAPFMGDFA